VRDGELSPEQREHLVTLLHLIDSAAARALWAGERYPDNPELAAVYAASAWEPVGTECARLLQQWSSNLSHEAVPATQREETALVTDTGGGRAGS
jgi:hypothetical protein